jgi:Tol biopolymer transport system component/DNA-binding winged helix-turn-helix (wHTH) protein
MATRPRVSDQLAFGPFRINVSAGELLKNGVPVRLPSQPFRVLMALLTRPGEVVTREQLQAEVWNDGTFTDFDHGLHAAINKLRRALNDSAEHPRYIETLPGRGYRFIGVLNGHEFTSDTAVLTLEEPRRARNWGMRRLTVAALCLAGAFAAGWVLHRAPEPRTEWKMTRLTAEAGLSERPALSPDGSLVAYSADRGGHGGRDLYVKHVAGGQPIRLTFDEAGNTTPEFSPDGTRIVYRSNRDGGGIYEIPAFGGDSRLVARDGLHPRYSPDGSRVAYWVGAESVAAAVPGSGAVWVVPLAGGPPKRVGAQLTAARQPLWSPDGEKLLVIGYSSAKYFDNSAIDWWLVASNGEGAVRTGAYEALRLAGLRVRSGTRTPVPAIAPPGCWQARTGDVTFAIRDGDGYTNNLWQIGLSTQTGKVKGAPRRLTTGSADEVQVSCASTGAIAFANVEGRSDIWLLPFEANGGAIPGPPQRIDQHTLWRDGPALARNARKVAFTSDESGQPNIWVRDLETREERSVAASSFVQRYPVSNASGSRIAFSVYEKDDRVVYVSAPGGTPDKVCEGCLRATDWSRDEKSLLVFTGAPYHIGRLDLASHREVPLVKHPQYPLLYGRFSPDNRWLSFTARIAPTRGRIAIARADGPAPVAESDWSTIAEAGTDDYAEWSGDGRTLYFTSSKDGYPCLWGQRIDTASGRPSGEAFAVQHFHGSLTFEHTGWSLGAAGIAMALVETTGNIWMMTPSRRADGL